MIDLKCREAPLKKYNKKCWKLQFLKGPFGLISDSQKSLLKNRKFQEVSSLHAWQIKH